MNFIKTMNIGKIFAVAVILHSLTLGLRAQEHEPEVNNRFYIGPRLHFNVNGTILNVPRGAAIGPQYDDGYVDIDISKNAGGKTWNWGYSTTNSQIFGASPNRELELHGADSPRDGTTDKLKSQAEVGFEVGYGRDFWKFGKEDYPTRVGIELSFSAAGLGLDSRNTVSGLVTRTSDRYFLGSVIPPNGPYSGSFEGPAPPNPPGSLIPTNIISRTTSTESATASQHVDLDGTYYGVRLGPYIEVPWPGYRHSFQGGLGLAMIRVDAKLRYEENFTMTGLGGPPRPVSDETQKQEWLLGFYANAKAYYWMNDVTALYLGAEFQMLQDFNIEAASKRANVDFGSTFGVTVGVMYVF
jgi:hypothetical protein